MKKATLAGGLFRCEQLTSPWSAPSSTTLKAASFGNS